MLSEQELILGCRKGNGAAQEALYKKYASQMRYVCLRYARTSFEVDDVFQDAFLKVFDSIDTYKGEGSLEGWIKRIVINTAINYYNKDKFKHNTTVLDYEVCDNNETADFCTDSFDACAEALTSEDVLDLVNNLPKGYKVIFNLYAIENYSHKEIAEMLQISEGTSKSQLFKARSLLKKMLAEYIQSNNAKTISIQFRAEIPPNTRTQPAS